MKFSELIAGLTGVEVGQVHLAGDPEIARVVEDSRKVGRGDLFVARAGTKVSGAKFAVDALAQGAVAIISEEMLEVPVGMAFAKISNPNRALALLAQRWAGDPSRDITLYGVTGTKGKTTITFLLRSILQAHARASGLMTGGGRQRGGDAD